MPATEIIAPTKPSESLSLGRWLVVEWLDQKKATFIWLVRSERGTPLGKIQWFGRWHCYAFDPAPQTTFNGECLRDIAGFLERVRSLRTGD